MFWGLDRDAWIGLWSGVIGSIVAAGVGALVALMVVTLSNRHQSALAERALLESRQQAKAQLEEQRREAGKAREVAAVADFVAAADKLHWLRHQAVNTVDILGAMTSALVRLELSQSNTDAVVEALQTWPYRVTKLAEIAKASQKESPQSAELQRDLSSLVNKVTVGLPMWVHGDEKFRAQLCNTFRNVSQETEERVEAALAQLRTEVARPGSE